MSKYFHQSLLVNFLFQLGHLTCHCFLHHCIHHKNYTKDTSAVDTIETEETRINRLRYISFYDEYNDVKNNDKLNDLIEKGNLREVTDEDISTYPRAILKKKDDVKSWLQFFFQMLIIFVSLLLKATKFDYW
jgi:hypothetical protein